MVETVLVGVWLDLVTAAFFLYVAWRVAQVAQGPGRVERALRWSQFFWIGTAAFMLLDGGYGYMVAPRVPEWTHGWVLALRRIIFAIGLAGLLHLLITLQTRTDRHVAPLLAATAGLVIVLEAISLYQDPLGVRAKVWGYEMVMRRETPLWINMAIGTAMFAPIGIAALGYWRTWHGETPHDRWRVASVAVGCSTFPLGILIGFWDNEWYWYGIFENRVAFSAALGILLAIRPPLTLRRFWGIPVLKAGGRWPGLSLRRSP